MALLGNLKFLSLSDTGCNVDANARTVAGTTMFTLLQAL